MPDTDPLSEITARPKRPLVDDDLIDRYSYKNGIDPELTRRVIHQESRGHLRAVSPKGAQGLMQLMPDTARSLGVTDPFNVHQNLDAGTKYLRQQLDEFGDPNLALAAYNAGPGAVRKFGNKVPRYAETQNYVKTIGGGYQGTGYAQDPLSEITGKKTTEETDPLSEVTAKPAVDSQRIIPPSLPPAEVPLKRIADQVTRETRRLMRRLPKLVSQTSYADMKRNEYPADLSPGELKQQDEQAVANSAFMRAQQRQEAGKQALQTNPMSAEARMYDPRENLAETAQQAQELQARESVWREKNQPEIDRQTAQYRQDIKKAKQAGGDVNQWLSEFSEKAASGLLDFGSVASDTARIKSEAMQRAAEEEGADRGVVSKAIQNLGAGLIGSAPEMAAMSLGLPPVAAFALGSGVRATGKNQDVYEAGTRGGLAGAAFEVPGVGQGLTKILSKAGGVGATTTGLELAQGQPLKQSVLAGAQNAVMSGGGEYLAKRGEAGNARQTETERQGVPAEQSAQATTAHDVQNPLVESSTLQPERPVDIREGGIQSGVRTADSDVAPAGVEHHSVNQARRVRNTEHGSKGQFKVGKLEPTPEPGPVGILPSSSPENSVAADSQAAAPAPSDLGREGKELSTQPAESRQLDRSLSREEATRQGKTVAVPSYLEPNPRTAEIAFSADRSPDNLYRGTQTERELDAILKSGQIASTSETARSLGKSEHEGLTFYSDRPNVSSSYIQRDGYLLEVDRAAVKGAKEQGAGEISTEEPVPTSAIKRVIRVGRDVDGPYAFDVTQEVLGQPSTPKVASPETLTAERSPVPESKSSISQEQTVLPGEESTAPLNRVPAAPADNLSGKLSKKLAQSQTAEGLTLSRKSPRGRASFDSTKQSLSQAVRALGGIRYDTDRANAGELGRLSPKESGTTGLVNKNSGLNAEQMAMSLAEEGYRGDWVTVIPADSGGRYLDVDGNKFLEAVERDHRGIEASRAGDFDVDYDALLRQARPEEMASAEALVSFLENEERGKLFDDVTEGRANESKIEQFTKQAKDFGISASDIEDMVAKGRSLSASTESVQDTLRSPSRPPEQFGFVEEGLTQQEAPRPVGDQRSRLIADEEARQSAAVDKVNGPDVTRSLQSLRESSNATVKSQAESLWKTARRSKVDAEQVKALQTFDRLKREGQTVDDYANQDVLFGDRPSAGEISALREIEDKRNAQAGAIDVDLLTLGVRPFAKDLASKLRETVAGTQEIADGVRSLLAPPSRSDQALQTSRVVRANAAEMARAHDIADKSLEGARKYFSKQQPTDNRAFIDRMERGKKQPDPMTQKFADTFRKMLDDRRDQIRALGTGKLDSFIEDYFPHVWKDPKKAASAFASAAAKRPLEGSKSFLKKRTLPFTSDGLKLGLEPVSNNPVDLAVLKLREMDKYLMAHQVMAEMKQQGSLKFFKASERIPDRWKQIDDRVATVFSRNDKGELILRGRYAAPEPAAKIVNNYLSPGLNATMFRVPFKAWRATSNLLNQFQLGFSAFHAGMTSIDAMVSRTAAGLEDIVGGKRTQRLRGLAKIASTPLAPLTNLVQGNRMLKEWYRPGSQGTEIGRLVDAMQQGGGRARMDQFYATNAAKRFVDTLRQGNVLGAAMRAPGAAIDLLSKPVMEHLVPRQKMGVFADLAKRELERLGPDATQAQIRHSMAKAWDSVDNRMGQLIYDNLFWDKTLKDLAMASVRSVGWNLGTIREIGGGLTDFAGLPKRGIQKLRGRNPDPLFTHRMAYTVALPLVVGTMGAMTQYLYTGKRPEELKDYFFPKTGAMDENGNPERISFPSYMKDVFHAWEEPGKVVTSKLHPLAGLVSEMLRNEDYYGTKIRNEDDPIVQQLEDAAKHIGTATLPFSVRGYQKETERDGSMAKRLLPFVGITPAPSYINKSPAEKLIGEKVKASLPQGSRTKEEAERSQLRHQLQTKVRKGQDITGEVASAIQQGKLKPDDGRDILRDAKSSPLQLRYKRLSLPAALEVWDIMSAEERADVKEILASKADSVDDLPLSQQEDIKKKMESIGLRPGVVPRKPREVREPRKPRKPKGSGYVFAP